MTVDEFLSKQFTKSSRPSKRSINRLIAVGELPGLKIGKLYYIDAKAVRRTTGNELVDRVLLSSV